MTEPLVSIIIVNYNGKQYLEQCLKSLMQINYQNFEIILVDNNSTDDSIEFVSNYYPSVIILKLDKNLGFAEPNNMGAKIAKGQHLLFLNNDTIVTPNFINEMIQVVKKDPKIGMCQSLLLKPNGEVDSSGDFITTLGVGYSSKEKVQNIREILSGKAASLMVRNEIFWKLKGFDEKFFASWEDVDLGWRAWISGYKVVVVPTSVVHHIGGQTVKNFKEIAFHGYKNQLAMKITNFESKTVFKNLMLFFGIYSVKMIKVYLDYKIKGKTTLTAVEYEDTPIQKPNILIILKSILWMFKNMKYLQEKHKFVNSSRVFSTNDLEKMKLITPHK